MKTRRVRDAPSHTARRAVTARRLTRGERKISPRLCRGATSRRLAWSASYSAQVSRRRSPPRPRASPGARSRPTITSGARYAPTRPGPARTHPSPRQIQQRVKAFRDDFKVPETDPPRVPSPTPQMFVVYFGRKETDAEEARMRARRRRYESGEVTIDVPRVHPCLLYTSPSPRDGLLSRMPSSA